MLSGFLRVQWLSETTWISEDDSPKRGKTAIEHNVDIAIDILLWLVLLASIILLY